MIVPEITKVAIREFRQKMESFGENLNSEQLTAE